MNKERLHQESENGKQTQDLLDIIDRLLGSLQNCINHLERIQNSHPERHDLDGPINHANLVLKETKEV